MEFSEESTIMSVLETEDSAENMGEQDVYIDSVFEVTNIVPEVGVKVEVNEDTYEQVPFLQDPSTLNAGLAGYLNPIAPERENVKGSGSVKDPITLDKEKDLFVRGTLGSSQKPIDLDGGGSRRNGSPSTEAVVVDADEHNTNIVQSSNYSCSVIEIHDYGDAEIYEGHGGEVTEDHDPVEVIPKHHQEQGTRVEISSVPFNQKGTETCKETDESVQNKSVSFITFSNDNQLVIKSLTQVKEHGNSYVLDEKELNHINKSINKPPTKRKPRTLKDMQKTIEKKKTKKKSVNKFEKWGGRVSKSTNLPTKEKEKTETMQENSSTQKNGKGNEMSEQKKPTRRAASKNVNYSEEIDKDLIEECVGLSFSNDNESNNFEDDDDWFAGDNGDDISDKEDNQNFESEVTEKENESQETTQVFGLNVKETNTDVLHSENIENQAFNGSELREINISRNNKEQRSALPRLEEVEIKLEHCDIQEFTVLNIFKNEPEVEDIAEDSSNGLKNLKISKIQGSSLKDDTKVKKKRGRPKKKNQTNAVKASKQSKEVLKKSKRKITTELEMPKPKRSKRNVIKSINHDVNVDSNEEVCAEEKRKRVGRKIKRSNVKEKDSAKVTTKLKRKRSCKISETTIETITGKLKHKGKSNEKELSKSKKTKLSKTKRKKLSAKEQKDEQTLLQESDSKNSDEHDDLNEESNDETDEYVPSGADEVTASKSRKKQSKKKKKTAIAKPTREWPCAKCNEIFPKRDSLRAHRMEVHSSSSPSLVNCEHCDAVVFIGMPYKMHKERVHGIVKEVECLCKEKFTASSTYIKHKRTCGIYQSLSEYKMSKEELSEGKEKRSYMCEICGMTFHLKGSLYNHERYFHNDPKLKCPFCPIKVKTKSAILYHVYSHKDIKDIVLPDEWEFSTELNVPDSTDKQESIPSTNNQNSDATASGLQNVFDERANPKPSHSESRLSAEKSESNALNDRIAAYIEKIYSDLSSKAAATDDLTELYNCPVCDFNTKSKVVIKDHILRGHAMKSRKKELKPDNVFNGISVEGKRKFEPRKHKYTPKNFGYCDFLCSICGQGHASRTSLSDHIASIHNKVITRHCEVCGKGFMAYYAYMRHKRNVHGLFRHPHKKRGHSTLRVCEVCGQSISKTGYKKHIDMHNGVFRFQCEVCQKSCRSKHDLSVHSRIHTGEKPYSCEICDRKFSDLANLRHHEQRLHKIEKKKDRPSKVEELDDLQRELLRLRTRRMHLPMEESMDLKFE